MDGTQRLKAYTGGIREVAMLTIFVQGIIVALAIYVIWRLLSTRMARPGEPDDLVGSPARVGPRPKFGAGAVALEEPDEDEESN
jgi:hypothetical protein